MPVYWYGRPIEGDFSMQNLDCLWAADRSSLVKFFHEASAMDVESRLKYFHDVFPYAELLPLNLYLFDANQVSIACNQETIKGMGDKLITDYIDHTLPAYTINKGWPTWAYKKQLEHNRNAIIHGHCSGDEFTKEGKFIKKWVTRKEALYDDNGGFLGIIGVSICGGLRSELISWDAEAKQITLNLTDTQNVNLSLREFTVLQGLIHGGTAQEIGFKENLSTKTIETYIMRIRVKFNCQKLRDVITLLIQNELAKDIMRFRQDCAKTSI